MKSPRVAAWRPAEVGEPGLDGLLGAVRPAPGGLEAALGGEGGLTSAAATSSKASSRASEPAGPTQTVTGTSASSMTSRSCVEPLVVDDATGAVDLQHDGDRAALVGRRARFPRRSRRARGRADPTPRRLAPRRRSSPSGRCPGAAAATTTVATSTTVAANRLARVRTTSSRLIRSDCLRGSSAVPRCIPPAHRGREGRRGQNHRQRRRRRRRRPPGSVGAAGRDRGEVRAWPGCSVGSRSATTRSTWPPASAAARSPRTRRCSSTSASTGSPASPSGW